MQLAYHFFVVTPATHTVCWLVLLTSTWLCPGSAWISSPCVVSVKYNDDSLYNTPLETIFNIYTHLEMYASKGVLSQIANSALSRPR